MEEEFLLNCGIQPQFHSEHTPLSAGSMPALLHPLNSLANDFLFESAVGTMPIAGSFMIRELMGKLGGIYSSADISPPVITSSGAAAMNNNSNDNCCYNATSLSSPHRISIIPTILDHLANEQDHLAYTTTSTSVMNSIPLTPNLSPLSRDLGSATNFSSSFLKSRTFNERTCLQARLSNDNTSCGGMLTRVSSSTSPKKKNAGYQTGKQSNKSFAKLGGCHVENSACDCRELSKMTGKDDRVVDGSEHSSLSGQKRSEENHPEQGNYTNSRKRKTKIKGKEKEFAAPTDPATSSKRVAENGDDERSPKRAKTSESNGDQEKENNEDNNKKQSSNENDQKVSDVPKDYIHVRARRGQATDSHSLAERVRREKISERMKLLQDLVPGCNKVTGKALMLDEIINYVQSLQKQVEFLSMKLASLNPSMVYNVDTLCTKGIVSQPRCSHHPQQMYPSDSSRICCDHQPDHHQHPSQTNITSTTMSPCSNDFSHAADHHLNQDHSMLLPSIDGLHDDVPQIPSSFEDDDLQSIVDMFLGQNADGNATIRLHSLHGPNAIPLTKID
ncbi:hypothetical protein Drorol1_Dr00003898 [Drosera rotundifolia]